MEPTSDDTPTSAHFPSEMVFLPIPLRPDERRDLVKRLVERLGTRTAGGFPFVAELGEAGPGGRRLSIRGEAGEVRVEGAQSFEDGRQRDQVNVEGLPATLRLTFSVDERAPDADAPEPTRLKLRRGDPASRAAAVAEAFRLAGERFSALLVKKAARIQAVPVPPLDRDELLVWIRGRWKPAPAPIRDARLLPAPHLEHLALVEDPKRSGAHLLVREVPDAPERSVAPLAVLPPGGAVGGFEIGTGFDARRLEKALATLAWDTLQQTATDPRPKPEPFATPAPGTLHTAALVLFDVRAATGSVRPAARGHGPRLASADLSVTGAGGAARGELAERHLYGLAGEGFVILASSRNEGRTAALLGGPPAAVPKWIAKLEAALR